MVVRRRRGGLGLTIRRERCNPKRVIEVSERALIGEVANRLAQKYPTVPQATVSELVNNAHSTFNGSPLRDFVPLLVERRAKAQLKKLSVQVVAPPVTEAV